MSGTIILVLVIAGVLVLAGIGLIVFAVLLGRQRTVEPGEPSPRPPGRGPTFIDEPLQRDLSTELGTQAESQSSADPSPQPPGPGVVSGQAGAPSAANAGTRATSAGPRTPPVVSTSAARSAVARTEGGPGRQLVPEGIRAGGVGPRQASYEFRVELGFRCLAAGQFARTVAEFRKAIALTDDDDAKAELLMEMGNASRMAGDIAGARTAYEEAITYSRDPLVWDHLHDWIEQLAYEERWAQQAGPSDDVSEGETTKLAVPAEAPPVTAAPAPGAEPPSSAPEAEGAEPVAGESGGGEGPPSEPDSQTTPEPLAAVTPSSAEAATGESGAEAAAPAVPEPADTPAEGPFSDEDPTAEHELADIAAAYDADEAAAPAGMDMLPEGDDRFLLEASSVPPDETSTGRAGHAGANESADPAAAPAGGQGEAESATETGKTETEPPAETDNPEPGA